MNEPNNNPEFAQTWAEESQLELEIWRALGRMRPGVQVVLSMRLFMQSVLDLLDIPEQHRIEAGEALNVLAHTVESALKLQALP